MGWSFQTYQEHFIKGAWKGNKYRKLGSKGFVSSSGHVTRPVNVYGWTSRDFAENRDAESFQRREALHMYLEAYCGFEGLLFNFRDSDESCEQFTSDDPIALGLTGDDPVAYETAESLFYHPWDAAYMTQLDKFVQKNFDGVYQFSQQGALLDSSIAHPCTAKLFYGTEDILSRQAKQNCSDA